MTFVFLNCFDSAKVDIFVETLQSLFKQFNDSTIQHPTIGFVES